MKLSVSKLKNSRKLKLSVSKLKTSSKMTQVEVVSLQAEYLTHDEAVNL